MPLVTLDEVTDWLGIDVTGDQRAIDLLTRFIATASTKVEGWCRQSFGVQAIVTEVHQLDGSGIFYLSRTPVNAVTAISVTDESVPPVTTILTAADFDIDFYTGKVTLIAHSSMLGFSTTSFSSGQGAVPDQVKDATIQYVSMLWYGKGRDAAAVSQNSGSFSKTLGVNEPHGLPESAITLLLDYRRVLGELI